MKRNVYQRGVKGKKYGIWNASAKCWQFNIAEDTPMLAVARLHQKIGDDAKKWRFEPRILPDKLIENGVILPPCKVGDTVYVRNRANKPQAMKFDSVDLRCTCEHDDECMCGSLCNDKGHNICQYRFKNDFSDFGKTVFLTKEEAQKVLDEGR